MAGVKQLAYEPSAEVLDRLLGHRWWRLLPSRDRIDLAPRMNGKPAVVPSWGSAVSRDRACTNVAAHVRAILKERVDGRRKAHSTERTISVVRPGKRFAGSIASELRRRLHLRDDHRGDVLLALLAQDFVRWLHETPGRIEVANSASGSALLERVEPDGCEIKLYAPNELSKEGA